MSALNLDIPHNLSQEEAQSRIKQLLSNLKNEQKDTISNVQEHWEGKKCDFSFKAKGFNLSGNMIVNNTNVQINSELPFALSFFKGAIADVITKKAKELLT